MVPASSPLTRQTCCQSYIYLLTSISAEPDIARFKNTLKTYFFKLAFDLLG